LPESSAVRQPFGQQYRQDQGHHGAHDTLRKTSFLTIMIHMNVFFQVGMLNKMMLIFIFL